MRGWMDVIKRQGTPNGSHSSSDKSFIFENFLEIVLVTYKWNGRFLAYVLFYAYAYIIVADSFFLVYSSVLN